MNKHDYNKDGDIDENEVNLAKAIREFDIKKSKLSSQKRMAWFCLALIAIITFLLFTPFVSDTRIDSLSDILGMFYIACSGVAGAYVGVTAWMSRK